MILFTRNYGMGIGDYETLDFTETMAKKWSRVSTETPITDASFRDAGYQYVSLQRLKNTGNIINDIDKWCYMSFAVDDIISSRSYYWFASDEIYTAFLLRWGDGSKI